MTVENLKQWFMAEKNQDLWRKNKTNGRIGSEKKSQRTIEKSYHASRRYRRNEVGIQVFSSPSDWLMRSRVLNLDHNLIGRKRHLASVSLKTLLSKLKRKLAIVNSKIKYYWFHISERISRVVQKETVHNSTCKNQRVSKSNKIVGGPHVICPQI